jgi:hypothetical protein
VEPQTPPSSSFHAHRPPSRSHTARFTAAVMYRDRGVQGGGAKERGEAGAGGTGCPEEVSATAGAAADTDEVGSDETGSDEAAGFFARGFAPIPRRFRCRWMMRSSPSSRIVSSDAPGCEWERASRAVASFSRRRRGTVRWTRLSSAVFGSTTVRAGTDVGTAAGPSAAAAKPGPSWVDGLELARTRSASRPHPS